MKMNPYFYRVTVDRVLDGDTLDAVFDLGFNITNKVRVRLMGYDAPETWRPSSDAEMQAGLAVKAELTRLVTVHADRLYCESTNIDLYGRSSGIIHFKDDAGELHSINAMVIEYMTTNHLTKGA